ncbi:MAG TPA: histidine kinase [Anaerolineales bacterium]
MIRFIPGWRGLTQLFAFTILPLTLLLLVIAFGGVNMHQQDMRALVGERDERAVQSSAAALQSELHHRIATITSMEVLASEGLPFETIFATTNDLTDDFNGEMAFLDSDGGLLANTGNDSFWTWVSQNAQSLSLTSPSDTSPFGDDATALSTSLEPVFSTPILDPNSKRLFVIVSAFSASRDVIVAGAFSPETLAAETLSTTYPTGSHVTIYLLDGSRRLLFVSGVLAQDRLESDHPGVTEALQGESGVLYVKKNETEHVVAYSPIESTGWALITEEEWEMVISPSLQLTQMAPLVMVPAFILALIALWFGANQIVQPLQRLESKAAALAWGDFDAIKESVGGISEVQHLQLELTEMSRKVQAAQNGLHDYIGAITSAQEEERLRLARELHDDTIQAVIALKQRVQLAQKSIKDQHGRQSLNELEILAEQTIENLRRLTRALRPIYLEDLGLVTALEMLTRETSQNNHLVVGFQKTGQERRLSREVELSLYRIAQEALNNVVKHSKATHADLRITFETSGIKMEVSDNGNGFIVPKSPTELAPSGHFGLLGVHERADLINARLEIESVLRKGTRLKVVLSEALS